MYRLIYSEFQYSFCSYSTKRRIIRFDNSSFVSIQLLFLFNHSATSRKVTSRFVSIQLLFLFNLHVRHEGQYGQKFQYSFCSYSTENQRTFKPDWPVSIQLLFLFNSSLCFRFLLLLVSIQLLFLFNFSFLRALRPFLFVSIQLLFLFNRENIVLNNSAQ